MEKCPGNLKSVKDELSRKALGLVGSGGFFFELVDILKEVVDIGDFVVVIASNKANNAVYIN